MRASSFSLGTLDSHFSLVFLFCSLLLSCALALLHEFDSSIVIFSWFFQPLLMNKKKLWRKNLGLSLCMHWGKLVSYFFSCVALVIWRSLSKVFCLCWIYNSVVIDFRVCFDFLLNLSEHLPSLGCVKQEILSCRFIVLK